MTINLADNDPRVSYSVAAGVTQSSFTVSFEFFDDEDLNVYVDGIQKTLTNDYTVTGGDGSTGSIAMSVTGAAGGSTVVITRSIVLERTTDFPVSGAFNIASLNTELDRFVAINADLNDQISRSIRLEDYDVAGGLSLPSLEDRKGKTLAFDTVTGGMVAGPSISSGDAIANAITEIEVVADDLQNGSYVAGGQYDFGSITDTSVGSTGSPDGFIVTVYNNLASISAVNAISANVSTVAGISSDVTTAASNATDISSVATNISNVNAAASNESNINAAVSNATNINAVAANEADIDSVAASIANVDTVAGISANVTTVAGISADVTAVAADATDIGTVAALDTEIGALGAITSDITAVNTNSANITAVAGNNTDISTVAGISANVTTVAGISSDIATVVADATDIGTVAGDSANIQALGPISANITTVAGISSDVTTVANNATDTTTVAGISANVTTVAGVSANVTTVAGISADVTTVAGDSADIQTVADNIASVNDFADKYRIGATDPTTDLDEGDLFYNTTSDTLKVYTGSEWEAGVTAGSGFLAKAGGVMTGELTLSGAPTSDLHAATKAYVDTTVAATNEVVEDTTPQLGGSLDVNGNSIVSVANGDIAITPDGTGSVVIDGLSHPQADGSAGQFLKTDGSGQLAFATVDTDLSNDTTPQLGGDLDGQGNNIYTLQGNIGSDAGDYITFTTDTRMDVYVNGSNEFRFESDGDFHADGNVVAYSTTVSSDERLKTNIQLVNDPLGKLSSLRGVTFEWLRDGKESAGVIAQDVQNVLPEAVTEVTGMNGKQHLTVNYSALTSILIEAIKELKAEVEELKNGTSN